MGYTLAEVIVVMLIIAVIVAVTIGITKGKLDNIVSYTYYNAYSTLRKISTEMLADWDPQDPEYKQALNNKNLFAFNAPNDYRFFSIILSHTPLALRFQPNRAKAGDRLTVYGCASGGKYIDAQISSSRFEKNANFSYDPKTKTCSDIIADIHTGYDKCPGTYKGHTTYAAFSVSIGCVYDCTTMERNSSGCKGGKCCGPFTGIFDATCNGNEILYDFMPKNTTVQHANIISSTLIEGNMCKNVIECQDGYEWLAYDSDYGLPAGVCHKIATEGGSSGGNSGGSGGGSSGGSSGGNSGGNTCTKKCYISEQKLDPNTCSCYTDCWDGTRTEYYWNCPDKVTCWDGSVVHSQSECPACTKSCSEGYELNTSSCECIKKQVTCWDGSKADSTSSCPGYVTCWNGNKAHNWSECPACPNKPACPASWDDKTCTGSAKTCPSGQHLNSSCGCVNDCPTDISPCNICSNETGIVSQNPAINRSCSDETYEWSEEQCKCIPSPRTLPRKGMNFCKLFERHANIMSGSDVCNGSVISNGTTDFSNKSPDITLRNGLRIYNMHNDAGAISMLANNTQGGVYDGVPNTNSYGYTVYVDIDGVKGDSQLWSDVYPFYITLSGKIIPAYDTSNPEQSGGDSVRHLQVSVENENYASGKRSIKWLAKSVPFKEGACISGYVGDATPYCKNGTSFTKAGECTTNYNSLCRVKQIQPVKFFF